MTSPSPLPVQPGPNPAPIGADPQLDWLLEDLCRMVPGVAGAVLTSRDGLKLAAAGLSGDRADPAAALVSSLFSLAKGVGAVGGRPGEVLQVAVEHEAMTLIVMSTGRQVPANQHAQPRIVDCALGVLAEPEADMRMVGREMLRIAHSVAEYLVTATRASEAPSDGAGGGRE